MISHDEIIVNGVPAALPRFYDGKLPDVLPEGNIGLYSRMELIKLKRRRKLTRAQLLDQRSSRRRYVLEQVALARLAQKARTI